MTIGSIPGHLQDETQERERQLTAKESISRRRVVITGLGAITNIGHTQDACWKSILAGASCIGQLTAFEHGDDWTVNIDGEIKDH